jgi:hypothetical protein
MRNLDFWASAWRLFTWWKKEKIQIETRRVFTKYPSELLQDDAATSSSQHERWAKEGDENEYVDYRVSHCSCRILRLVDIYIGLSRSTSHDMVLDSELLLQPFSRK